MPIRSIWLSYDLGLQGEYASLYQWLDAHGAKECGDSTALVNVEYSKSLKDELARSIDSNKKTRIYIVYCDQDTGKIKGSSYLAAGERRLGRGTRQSKQGVSTRRFFDACASSLTLVFGSLVLILRTQHVIEQLLQTMRIESEA